MPELEAEQPGTAARLRMDAATAKPVIVYPRDCQVCYLCEDDCPTLSISLSHDISNSRRYSNYDEFESGV